MVVVAYWILAHHLQQVNNNKTKRINRTLKFTLGKVYTLIRIVLVCGLVDKSEHHNWPGVLFIVCDQNT